MDHTSIKDQTESADTQRKHPLASAVAMALAGVSLLGGCASNGAMSASEQVVNARAAFLRQDYATAARMLSEPAMKGDAAAQYALGYMYYYGQGVPKDLYRARAWLEHSANQGYPDAKQALALLTAYAKLPAPTATPGGQQPEPSTGLPSGGTPALATPPEPTSYAPSPENAPAPASVSTRCEPPASSTTAQGQVPAPPEPAGVAKSQAQPGAGEAAPIQTSTVPAPLPQNSQPNAGVARAPAVAVEAAPHAAPQPSPNAPQPQPGASAQAHGTLSAPLPMRPGLQGPGVVPETVLSADDSNPPANSAATGARVDAPAQVLPSRTAVGGENSGPHAQALPAVGTKLPLLPVTGEKRKMAPEEEAGQSPLSPERENGAGKGALAGGASDAPSVSAPSKEPAAGGPGSQPNRPGSELELAAFGAPVPHPAVVSVSDSTPAAHVGGTPGHDRASMASSPRTAQVDDARGASAVIPTTFASGKHSGPSPAQEHPRYTMHLLASSDKADLVRLVRANGLSHAVSYYKVVHSDGPHYHLILGGFDTLAEARAALNALPEGLYRSKPWINNYPEQVVIMHFDESAGRVAELD